MLIDYFCIDDELVQWDHGAPGVMGAIVKGWKVTGNSTYLTSAELAADCVWERGSHNPNPNPNSNPNPISEL